MIDSEPPASEIPESGDREGMAPRLLRRLTESLNRLLLRKKNLYELTMEMVLKVGPVDEELTQNLRTLEVPETDAWDRPFSRPYLGPDEEVRVVQKPGAIVDLVRAYHGA